MTENEAKKIIKKFCEDRMNFVRGKDMSDKELEDFCKFSEALNLSISSLEEIQQYRSIGTVEEIQEKIGKLQRWHDEHLEDITVDLAEYRDLCKLEEVEHMKTLKRIIQRNGTIGKALDECAEYEEIGTVDECRKAMERQVAKKPTKDEYNHDCCPNCGWIVYQDEWGGRYLPHCENCGQAIDFGGVNEI